MANSDRRAHWSQLPEELLSLISKKHLNTRIDNLRFRSVCRSWRSSIPLFNEPPPPPPLPLLAPSPTNRNGFYSLTETTIYLLQPPNQQNPKPNTPTSIPWLVRVEEIENGKKGALHPLSQRKMPETFPKQLNLHNFRITELGKAHRLRYIDLTKDYFNDDGYTFVDKVVVSSSPWSGADDYAVMAMQNRKLWFFKLGDKKWTKIADWNLSDWYTMDLVYHNGQFYAVGAEGRTVVIGSDLKPKPIASLGPHYGNGTGYGNALRLVKSCGDLFLIDKEDNINIYHCNDGYDGNCVWDPIESQAIKDPLNKVVYLKVLKLNETEKKWERIGTLGDRVLFLCNACSYSISARDFSGLKGGCIYFSDYLFVEDGEVYDEEDEWCAETDATGVFSSVDGKCGPLAYFPDYSNIFWPPPPWLEPASRAIKKRMVRC